jgi:hypothetical protein
MTYIVCCYEMGDCKQSPSLINEGLIAKAALGGRWANGSSGRSSPSEVKYAGYTAQSTGISEIASSIQSGMPRFGGIDGKYPLTPGGRASERSEQPLRSLAESINRLSSEA